MVDQDMATTIPAVVAEATTTLIPGLSYRDDFLTSTEEAGLLAGVHAHPTAWKTLRNRTLQNWGGLPHAKGMLPTPLPSFLQPIVSRIGATVPGFASSPSGLDVAAASTSPADGKSTDTRKAVKPNHVLVNRYLPGQGIDAHTDGPAYRPVAAIVSLAAPLVMRFATPQDPSAAVARVLLRPRSLLVITGRAYTDFLHAIDEAESDLVDESVFNARAQEIGTTIMREERVSLTVRASCRTIKNSLLGRRR